MIWLAYICLFLILILVYVLRHKIFGTTTGLYYAAYRVGGLPSKSIELVNVNLNNVALSSYTRTPSARITAALAKLS